MTEQDWLTCADPYEMFDFIVYNASDRKLRLFACACCRTIWHVITEADCRNAVDMAEQFATGLVTASDLQRTYTIASKVAESDRRTEHRLAACAAAGPLAWRAAEEAFEHTINTLLYWKEPVYWAMDASTRAAAYRSEAAAICGMLREVFGNPLRPSSLDPMWLTPTVKNMATVIHDERSFDMMPILGDALGDGGCTSPDILSHCRSQGKHARGCWVLDLLVGQEEACKKSQTSVAAIQGDTDARP